MSFMTRPKTNPRGSFRGYHFSQPTSCTTLKQLIELNDSITKNC